METGRIAGSGSLALGARIAVGAIWPAGAAFNALVTVRMPEPYGWIADESPLRPYRWFFADVVGAHPARWTAALAVGEATIGALTLCRGRWARLGLAGGALFSALLFSLATPYTLVMGPYALFLAWLACQQQGRWGLLAGVQRSGRAGACPRARRCS